MRRTVWFRFPKFRHFLGDLLQYIFTLAVIYFSLSLESFPNLGRKFHKILKIFIFVFPKNEPFFGNLKLALCAVPLGKSLTVGRSIPPGHISDWSKISGSGYRKWILDDINTSTAQGGRWRKFPNIMNLEEEGVEFNWFESRLISDSIVN